MAVRNERDCAAGAIGGRGGGDAAGRADNAGATGAADTICGAQAAAAGRADGPRDAASGTVAHRAREGADRAKQFMPFATLRGYYDAVKLQEREECPRRELQPEDIERISTVLAGLSRGQQVRITYYDKDAYVTMQGAVGEVVPALHWLSVVKVRIAFEDIESIEVVGANG